MTVCSEYSVRPHIARFLQTACLEIIIRNWDDIVILDCLAGDLAKD